MVSQNWKQFYIKSTITSYTTEGPLCSATFIWWSMIHVVILAYEFLPTMNVVPGYLRVTLALIVLILSRSIWCWYSVVCQLEKYYPKSKHLCLNKSADENKDIWVCDLSVIKRTKRVIVQCALLSVYKNTLLAWQPRFCQLNIYTSSRNGRF